MAQGAPTLKRVHFELGGKNPVIVFDDADLDRARDAVLFMIYSLNGQRCTSSSRALIQRSIYDKFTAELKARVEKIRVGHPLDPATEIGPLIHSRHVEKVLSYTEHAKSDGAEIATGGKRALDGKGNFVCPTLFTGADNAMRIAQEEIFGPVLTVIPFDDEADAIRIANDVRYGLAAYIWTVRRRPRPSGGAGRRRRHGMGQFRERASSADAVRRREGQRHRSRRRRLRLRDLHGAEEHRDRSRQAPRAEDRRVVASIQAREFKRAVGFLVLTPRFWGYRDGARYGLPAAPARRSDR